MGHKYIYKRGDRYAYRRRVPEEVRHLDQRREVKASLKTSDEKEAIIKADIYNKRFEDFWKALIKSGNAAGLEEKYKATVALARTLGFAYRAAEEIAERPLSEIISRLDKANDPESTNAVLGGTKRPKITMETCKERYFDIAIDKAAGKSERWLNKWKVDRTRAMDTMIEIVGNKAIDELCREDIWLLREYWRERIRRGINGDTANKQIRYTKEMIREAALEYHIDIDVAALYADTRFSIVSIPRPPFEPEYVQDVLIPALRDIQDDDVRLVSYAMADTGARNLEIISARPEHIKLDEKIPYLHIEGSKTRTSKRNIPLVGVALYAFKKKPEGFSKRWSNADSYSNLIGCWLRDNALLPTERHSIYSLRHTFKDRLRDVEAPKELIDELMGHKTDGPSYGRGHILEKKHKWMKKIAFKK